VVDSQRRCSDYVPWASTNLIYNGICFVRARKTREKLADRNSNEGKREKAEIKEMRTAFSYGFVRSNFKNLHKLTKK
jgi:hypothetical protein